MSEYVTLEAVAEHFKVSNSTARKWVASGFIPESTYVRSEKVYRFNLQAVEEAVLGKTAAAEAAQNDTDPRHFYKPKGNN